jgi:hypothetical protein
MPDRRGKGPIGSWNVRNWDEWPERNLATAYRLDHLHMAPYLLEKFTDIV